MTSAAKPTKWQCPDWRWRLFGTLVFGMMIAVLFRDLLLRCVDRWTTEPQYSHGFVVPLIASGLGWFRRDMFLYGTARSSASGLAVTLCGIVGHITADHFGLEAVDSAAFLFTTSGAALMIWGRRAFAGLWPSVLFIGFMLPLPSQIERVLSGPLQIIGANEAAWYIQTSGIPAIAQGNCILMGDTRLGVDETCSGLRMVLAPFAISTVAVIVSKRMVWEKLLILMSALPIALICNVVKIVATAIAYQSFERDTTDSVIHHLSGWLMMPLAMLLLFLELKLLDWLFVPAGDSRPGITCHAKTQSSSVQA